VQCLVLQPIVRHGIDGAFLKRQEPEVDSGKVAVPVRPLFGDVLPDDESLADNRIPDVRHDPRVPQHVGKRVRLVGEPETNGGYWSEVEVRKWNVWRVKDGERVPVRDPLAQELGRQEEYCENSEQSG
jgi:hypothetical protein